MGRTVGRWAGGGGGGGEVVALSITGPNINCHPPGGDLLIHVFATTSSTVSLLGQRLFYVRRNFLGHVKGTGHFNTTVLNRIWMGGGVTPTKRWEINRKVNIYFFYLYRKRKYLKTGLIFKARGQECAASYCGAHYGPISRFKIIV